jgi:phosphatidate cytidylyltransferase
MKTRVLTGLALLFPVLFLSGWAPPWLFMVVLIALVERGLYEYYFIARQGGLRVFQAPGYAAAAAVCLAQWAALRGPWAAELGTLVLFIVLVPALAVWLTPDSMDYLSGVSTTLFGVVYVGLTLSCLFPLRYSSVGLRFAEGRHVLLFLLAIICVGDIFAYFVGRTLGRRLIFPRISPRKTFEGSLGGLIASVVVGWVYARLFWRVAHWTAVIPSAACIAVAGQVGDLVESALKRSAHLKDSGDILPGHGGLLDRVDSLLVGAPVLWLLLIFDGLLRK